MDNQSIDINKIRPGQKVVIELEARTAVYPKPLSRGCVPVSNPDFIVVKGPDGGPLCINKACILSVGPEPIRKGDKFKFIDSESPVFSVVFTDNAGALFLNETHGNRVWYTHEQIKKVLERVPPS